jgi:FkbM family methyltransferase
MTSLRQLVRGLLPGPVRLWVRSRREWRAGEAEVALLAELWARGRTFVDVGANLGLYTRAARAHGMRVVAIEPNPVLAGNLRRLFPADVRVVSQALSDHAGRRTFYLPALHQRELDSRGSLEAAANPGYALRPIEVEAVPLDALGLEDVAILKIDVEGHELAVLGGASELLRRERPSLLVEIEERHHPGGSAAVFDFLAERDYECYFCWRDALWPFAAFDPRRHQSVRSVDPPDGTAPADYVNNFLFVWRGNGELLRRLAARAPVTD